MHYEPNKNLKLDVELVRQKLEEMQVIEDELCRLAVDTSEMPTLPFINDKNESKGPSARQMQAYSEALKKALLQASELVKATREYLDYQSENIQDADKL